MAQPLYPQMWEPFVFFQQGVSEELQHALRGWEISLAANAYKMSTNNVVQRDGSDAATAFFEVFKDKLADLERAYVVSVTEKR